MKNLANVLAILLLVAVLGLMVGCGCGTASNQTEENMVETPNGTTTQTPANNESTMQEDMNTPQGTVNENGMYDTNPIDGTVIEDGNGNGTVHDNSNGTVGGAVEDAVDGVGNAVGDVMNGVGNATEDIMDGVGNAVDGNPNTTTNNNKRNTSKNQ